MFGAVFWQENLPPPQKELKKGFTFVLLSFKIEL